MTKFLNYSLLIFLILGSHSPANANKLRLLKGAAAAAVGAGAALGASEAQAKIGNECTQLVREYNAGLSVDYDRMVYKSNNGQSILRLLNRRSVKDDNFENYALRNSCITYDWRLSSKVDSAAQSRFYELTRKYQNTFE